MSAKPMTRQEALVEAQRRWGITVTVTHRPLMPNPYRVVVYRMALDANEILGNGDSWEAAFAEADRREKGGAR